jgi:hypothetical protein
MTLQEKFNELDSEFDGASIFYHNTEECEKLADDYAVEFTEWLIKKCDFQKHGVWLYKGMEFTQKELLEVFKHDVE